MKKQKSLLKLVMFVIPTLAGALSIVLGFLEANTAWIIICLAVQLLAAMAFRKAKGIKGDEGAFSGGEGLNVINTLFCVVCEFYLPMLLFNNFIVKGQPNIPYFVIFMIWAFWVISRIIAAYKRWYNKNVRD